jgi:hypothetical protein
MQPQPLSVMIMSDVRHAELQREGARLRNVRQASASASRRSGSVVAMRHHVAAALVRAGGLLQRQVSAKRGDRDRLATFPAPR